MSKNNKKAPNLSNLIPLGQKNKRNALASQPTVKRAKIEDFNPSTLIATIEQSMKQDNVVSETLIINFLNSIKSTLIVSSKNGKILPSQCLALFSVCKKYPNLFTKTSVVECMCGILGYSGKESATIGSTSLPFKQQSVQAHSVTTTKLKQLHIAICAILLASFKDHQKWPTQLVKSYLDDSFTERVWVDLPECNLLVRNIETAFPAPGIDPRTFFPLASVSEQLAEIQDSAEVVGTSAEVADISEVSVVDTVNKIMVALTADDMLKPRFENNRVNVDTMVSVYIKDHIERKYIPESLVKNILRTFCSLAGCPEMRGSVVTKLDNWLLSKLQNVTVNMLTIMASSINQNIANNQYDITFCVYLMLKFKYKTSKPPVQIALLECIKRISEMHPNNLRNMLHIYMNNELFGTPTVSSGVTINQANPSMSTSTTHVITNKAISVTLPAIYFRFPVESIKILGDLLHEQICAHFTDIKSVKLLIRDLCRWIKFAHTNPGGVYTSFTSTGTLPDSLELLDLAQSLLVDRHCSDSLALRMNNPLFKQSYVDNIISVLCELQMLSIIRPSVKDTFKDKSDHEKKDLESIRHHYTTLRQIRYLTCKWFKTIFRLVESQISPDRMTFYIKQVMFLNVTRNNDQSYTIDDSYAVNEVWANEPDKMSLVKGLTEIPLSEKLIQTMISLGFEKHLCYRPSEIVEMLSELIIRASACASSDIMSMNVTKGETVINNMFACCSYDIELEDNDPKLQVAKTLAYKSSFWKVCQALVIMACHCTDSCGAFLWANYPTIKNLMKIVITNNFENANVDDEAIETERLHRETDAAKIIELECSLYGDMGDDTVSIDNSKLVNLLMLNLPQGATRQPPPDVLVSLKSINSFMKIGDRLSQCRNPDFLLEIVKSQDQSKVANRKWIIDLVKKTSEHNLECLPLLCLTEFIYHDLYDKISNKMPMASTLDTFKRLVQQIRQTLSSTKNESVDSVMRIVGAFSNSFFNRLSDSSAATRNIARECLYILLQPVGSPIAYMSKSSQFMDTLESLISVKLFQENAIICSIVDSLKETLKFETDIDVLRCYIALFATMARGCYKEWLIGVVDTLAILVLNRPIITDKLKSSDYNSLKSGQTTTLISDLLAGIFTTHIEYINEAPAIAIDGRNDVIMVSWKDKKLPMNVNVIQCQLAFLCWGIVKSAACKKLADMWFIKSGKSHELPQFNTLLLDSAPDKVVIPQWLVNAAVNSGLASTLCAILSYHIKYNRTIVHNITPALLFMPQDFVTCYLKLMNDAMKHEKQIVEAWITTEIKNKSSALSTVEKLYAKTKRTPTAFIDALKTHVDSTVLPIVEKANLTPKIIVKPFIKQPVVDDEKADVAMVVDESVDNIWSGLIQGHDEDLSKGLPISRISEAVTQLLSSADKDIKAIIGGLIKLLKDSKTHSETLRVLNKSDFKLLPLLRLTFRSIDQDSYNFCIDSFNYLFNSYPHIEKLSVWKMAYNLCLIQGFQFCESATIDAKMEEEEPQNSGGHQSYAAMLQSLVTDIMHGGNNDSQEILRKGPKIDQLTILGLGNSINIGDESYDIIHRLLFSSHSLYQYSAYFMSDLLHQSNIDSLRSILHSLLQKKALSNLNASRALDFIDACINHPKLRFPGVLIASNRHLWPQQNAQFEITEQELISLLALIINEADHLVQHNGLNSEHVNRVLSKRCELVEIGSSHPSMINKRFTIINRYLESKLHNPTMEKLTFALYSRMTSLISYGTDNQGLENDVFFSNVNCFSTDILQRIGKRLLLGLISPRIETQDLAIQACKAMVYRHPKLCVQLLPNISALSDGALDSMEGWLVFKKKRGNVLYSSLLHLLEIMAPFSLAGDKQIRTDVVSTLSNFLRLLIRYRDQPTLFAHFVTRLVNFIEKLITFGNGDESFVVEHYSEISALSRIYPQFKNLIGYGHKNLIGYGKKNRENHVLSLTDPLDEASLSAKSPLILQLESLENFRQEMKKCQHGTVGIAQNFKLLSMTESSMTGLCFDDLRQSLCHAMGEVRETSKQYMARYLNHYPEQATQFVSHCLIPNMMVANTYYWSRPFTDCALHSLRLISLLAPDVSPLCVANYGRLFVGGNNGRGNYKDSVALIEEILDNISLETFIDDGDLTMMSGGGVAAGNKGGGGATSASGVSLLGKDVSSGGGLAQKRHCQGSDHEAHKLKRSRFK